jgi:hypothetical protein
MGPWDLLAQLARVAQIEIPQKRESALALVREWVENRWPASSR